MTPELRMIIHLAPVLEWSTLHSLNKMLFQKTKQWGERDVWPSENLPTVFVHVSCNPAGNSVDTFMSTNMTLCTDFQCKEWQSICNCKILNNKLSFFWFTDFWKTLMHSGLMTQKTLKNTKWLRTWTCIKNMNSWGKHLSQLFPRLTIFMFFKIQVILNLI